MWINFAFSTRKNINPDYFGSSAGGPDLHDKQVEKRCGRSISSMGESGARH
jgi:hypothetical protein